MLLRDLHVNLEDIDISVRRLLQGNLKGCFSACEAHLLKRATDKATAYARACKTIVKTILTLCLTKQTLRLPATPPILRSECRRELVNAEIPPVGWYPRQTQGR